MTIDSVGMPAWLASVSGARPVVPTGDRFDRGRGDDEPPQGGREHQILALLAAGRCVEALDLLDDGSVAAPFAAVARADAGVRRFVVDVPELERLVASFGDGRDPALRWWAQALLAERLVLDLDGLAVDVADRALASMPTDELLPLTALAARARLRRAAATRAIFHASPESTVLARRSQDAAITDFLRCGFTDEALLTDVFDATVEVAFLGSRWGGQLERIIDNRSLLDDPRSLWPAFVDHLICVVGALVGDDQAADDARARLAAGSDRSGDLGPFPALAAIADLMAAGADDATVAATDAIVQGFDRRFLRLLWAIQLVLANWLADAGHPGADRRARAALAGGRLAPVGEGDLALHQLRFEISAGVLPDPDDVVGHLRRLRAAGRPESAARFAATLADELDRAGAPQHAAVVRAWAGETPDRMPSPVAASPVAPWLNSIGGPIAAEARSVQIAVLAPVLEVTAEGRPVRLGQAAALLLVHLALAPGPLHIEQVGDRLWPGTPLPTVRQRLNSLLHRVRRQHPALGNAVDRHGDVVVLDRRRCRVDLDAFAAASGPSARGSGPDPGVAVLVDLLTAARGNLCQAQFPYDEYLVDARHEWASTWSARAAEVIAADPAARSRLVATASALDLDLG